MLKMTILLFSICISEAVYSMTSAVITGPRNYFDLPAQYDRTLPSQPELDLPGKFYIRLPTAWVERQNRFTKEALGYYDYLYSLIFHRNLEEIKKLVGEAKLPIHISPYPDPILVAAMRPIIYGSKIGIKDRAPYIEIIKYLVENGADINEEVLTERISLGEGVKIRHTPLDLALNRFTTLYEKMLKEERAGRELSQEEQKEYKAFQEIVKYLKSKGAKSGMQM